MPPPPSVCWAEASLWGGSFIGLTGTLSFLISESTDAGAFGKWFLSNGITIPMTRLVPFYREQRQHQNVDLPFCAILDAIDLFATWS